MTYKITTPKKQKNKKTMGIIKIFYLYIKLTILTIKLSCKKMINGTVKYAVF